MNGTVPDSFAVDELDDLEDDGLGSIDLDDADPAPAKTKPGPKGAPTAARRAQLARLREERAGHRKGGVIESEAQRHAHRSNVVPSLAEVVAEVQRISMAGAMPTMAQFDESKPAVWASAAAHLQRLKLSWPQLADTAGLKPRGNRAAP
jgi:hypothetical protein